MQIVYRKILIFSLLAAFAGQGYLVYGDGVAAAQAPLTDIEQRGRSVYLSHNCAACHQIYGFGGFLGPDLTNAAQRVSRQRLDDLLTRGSLQMPAFGLSSDEIDAVEAYLRALDRTGVGVARHRVPPPVTEVLAAVEQCIADGECDGTIANGHRRFMEYCASCHVPLRANPLGPMVAPDPCGIAGRLTATEIDNVLTHGRLARGMPPAPLTPEQRTDVIAFLTWLHAARERLVGACGEGSTSDLPWWEFK